jgi:hypothetical protein
MFNDPLKITQIERYSERLDLTNAQKESLLHSYDQYLLEFEHARNTEIQKFEDLVTTFAEEYGFMQFQIPERAQIDALVSAGRRAMKSIERVDNAFFDTITGMFTEKQQRELKRIRNERSLDAYRLLVLGMVSEMNKSARPNMTELFHHAVGEESTQNMDALELYEQRMIRHSEDTLDVLVDVISQALDMVDELGFREMEREELFMLFMEEERMVDFKARGEQLLAPIQKQAHEISLLNWKTWKTLDSQIAEEHRRPFALVYFGKGFRDPVRGYTKLDQRFEKALGLSELNEGQRQELLSLLGDYNARSLTLATKYAKILVQAWEYRTIDQQSSGTTAYDEERGQAEAARQKLVDSTKSRLDGILGSFLLAILDDDVEKKKRSENGDVYYYEDSKSETGAVQVELSEHVQVNLAGGVYIPKPMGAEFAKNIAKQLGLGVDGEEIVNALYAEYRDKYQSCYDVVQAQSKELDQETSLGLGPRLRKKEELTEQATQQVELLDVAFFDDLAVVTGFKRDDPKVKMFEQYRVRKRITATDSRFGWNRTPGKVLDLVQVFVIDDEHLTVSDESAKCLQRTMLSYHEQADELFREIAQAEFDMNHLSDALMIANEMEQSRNSAAMAAKMQDRWGEVFAAIRSSKQTLARTNQEIVTRLLNEVSNEDYWTLRNHFVKIAYPKVFSDTGKATTMLTAAEGISTLNPAQKGELSRLSEQYQAEYWNLCEQMIEMEEAEAMEETGEKMVSRTSIKRQIDGEKLRFERSELNDRIRMRLRMVLNEDQIKHVPGLRPTVTASAENK